MKKTMLGSLAIIGLGGICYLAVSLVYDTHAPWILRHASLLVLGTIYSLIILKGSHPQLLFRLSFLPLCSPNWLSIQRIWIIWLGQWMFFTAEGSVNYLYAGYLLVVFGMLLDRIDGKESKSILAAIKFVSLPTKVSAPYCDQPFLAWYKVEEENEHGEKVLVDKLILLENWIWHFAQGKTIVPMFRIERSLQSSPCSYRLHLTRTGEWLDPLSDKINFLPLFCYLVYRDMLYWQVVVLMVSSDLFSTIIREPFLSLPGFRRLQKYIRESKASPLGKTKIIWQFLTLLCIIPAAANWLSPIEMYHSKIIASCLLGLGLIVGILSTASRLTVWNSLLQSFGLRQLYLRFQKGYEHEAE